MENLAGRLCHRVQLTTDGHNPYLEAIDGAFKNDIDYARLLKIHESPKRGRLLTSVKTQVRGNPDPALISTSYVERQNLTMRMGMRSFTRKTNAFSKKFENHCHAISLHFIYYNFCRVHQTLKTIPAMAAGINDHVWSVTELCMLAARG